MINLNSSVKQDNFFESVLIDVIDFETNEILYTNTNLRKVARLLNIRHMNIHNFIYRKTKRGYYENQKTKKRYIFKLSKNESKS
jgi:hypothetical protein